MAVVGNLGVSDSGKARRPAGSHLFESDQAFFRTERLNVPVVIGRNQWTTLGPSSSEAAKTEAVRRIAFNNQGVDPLSLC